MRVSAPPAQRAGRRRQAARYLGTPLDRYSGLARGSLRLTRSVAHLLVLSIVVAVLPTVTWRPDQPIEWVEDVGGFDSGALQYERELSGASDGRLPEGSTRQLTVEPAPVDDDQSAETAAAESELEPLATTSD